jgi:PAS domain S-box-containing protein
LQTAANGIIITNSEGIIEWVNPAFTLLTGYSPEEAIGKNPRELVKSGQHPPEFYAQIWQTITAGEVWSGRVVNKRKDGTLYTEEQTITPVRDDLGRISHFIAIKQDASKQESAEKMALERERLTASLKKEQEYNANIQHVIDTLAHDLRTPLTVIATARDLLSHYFDRIDPAKRQQKLDTIGKQLNYVTELLNDLTLVAGSTLNHRQLQPRPISIATLCQVMAQQMHDSTGENHQMVFINREGIETAVLDEVLLNRILLNLLSNAIKYSPAHTTIHLELTHEKGQNWLTLRISDQGSGISQSDLPHIFDPFFRANAVRISHIAGTGLGLSIVKNCVEQHQGHIHVESALGVGSTFTIHLPLNLPPGQPIP